MPTAYSWLGDHALEAAPNGSLAASSHGRHSSFPPPRKNGRGTLMQQAMAGEDGESPGRAAMMANAAGLAGYSGFDFSDFGPNISQSYNTSWENAFSPANVVSGLAGFAVPGFGLVDLASRGFTGQGLVSNFMDAWGPANTVSVADPVDPMSLDETRGMTPAEINAFNESMTDPATHAGSWDINPATGKWDYSPAGGGPADDGMEAGGGSGPGGEQTEAEAASQAQEDIDDLEDTEGYGDDDSDDSGDDGGGGGGDDGEDEDADDGGGGGGSGGGGDYHSGGPVHGQGDVPATLEGQEFIVRKEAADYYGDDVMRAINEGRIARDVLKAAARGGR